MIFLHFKFDQVSEIKAKPALVGSFVMIFDYNVPILVEKVSKQVQMERYQPQAAQAQFILEIINYKGLY